MQLQPMTIGWGEVHCSVLMQKKKLTAVDCTEVQTWQLVWVSNNEGYFREVNCSYMIGLQCNVRK